MKRLLLSLATAVLMIVSVPAGTLPVPPGVKPAPLVLTAPNGGESWPLGSMRLITWSPGGAGSYVRLDLYRGGTALANKVGTIMTNTFASTGKYSWKVGEYIGGTAPKGGGYRIVITSSTPELKDYSDGAFTITQGTVKPGLVKDEPGLILTNPRRGDRWHKGTGYTITWKSAHLKDAKVKLHLLSNDEQTVVETIQENIDNTGQLFWAVPMSLPNAETYYKMRIQTMDNAYSDMVGPFSIAKGKAPFGPPYIKVVAPGGPGQLGNDIVYPIRWQSTCGKSTEGPTDDGFIIDLMDADGTTGISNLLYAEKPASYDGEDPTGVHNWHWDWHIAHTKPGTYRIRVENLSGHCKGFSKPFQLVSPQQLYWHRIDPVLHNCVYILNWCCDGCSYPWNEFYRYNLQGILGYARVGYYFFYDKDSEKCHGFTKVENIVLRSKLSLGDPFWYKDKGHLLKAEIVYERKWETGKGPFLGGVVVLTQDVACSEKVVPYGPTPPLPPIPGTVIPIKDLNFERVDLTQAYQLIIQNNKPDYGVMLYPAYESSPGGGDFFAYASAACYKVYFYFRFAKDIEP